MKPTPESIIKIREQHKDISQVSLDSEKLKLASFISDCVADNLRKSEVIEAAKESGIEISYGRLRQLMKRYREDKEKAFVRKPRKDADEPRSFSNEVILKMQQLFVEFQNATLVYEHAHRWLRESAVSFISSATGEEFPIVNGNLCEIRDGKEIISMYTSNLIAGTYITDAGEMKIGTLRAAQRQMKFYRDYHGDAIHYNKFGVEDFRLKRQHSMKINYSHLQPAEMISGDNKVVDIIVISEDWKSVYRPWLSCWYDLPTRRFCYDIGRSANSQLVTNSLVKAITEWGVPKEINHDRGADYLSNMVQNFAKALSLEKRISKRKLARAKPVESFFAGLDLKLLDLPGATGNKYKEMPQRTRRMLLDFTRIKNEFDKSIEKLYDKKSDFELSLTREREGRLKASKNRFMHITEFVEILDKKLETYHNKIHRGLKNDKLGRDAYKLTCEDSDILEMKEKINTPCGRFEYKVRKGFQPVFASPESLSLFTMRYELRTVQLTRGITFNNEEYYSPKLKRLAGQRVLIRFISINSPVLYIHHSAELQKISDKKYITSEILRDLDFICIAGVTNMVDYNDPVFKDHLAIQRAEEKSLKEITQPAKISRLTGVESEVSQIKQAELELIQNNKLKQSSDNELGEWRDLYDVS